MSFEPLKKFFEKKGEHHEFTEDLMKNILVKNKNNMWLYIYSDAVLVERNHPVLIHCRGLVLDSEGSLLNYPFTRFFNTFEQEKGEMNWNTAKFIEKLDGSLICVFWNGVNWEITTRGSFYPNDYPDACAFDEWFKSIFTKFDELDRDYCYMFELISKNNRIVTLYKEEFVSLIGMRNLKTLKEVSVLNHPWFKSRVYELKNEVDAKKLLESMPDDFEGFVILDENFNRLKLKSEEYLRLARIKSLREEDFFNVVVKGETIDLELVRAFSDVQAKLDEIKEVWSDFKKIASEHFNRLQPLSEISRKDFALEAIKLPLFKSVLFGLLDGKALEEVVDFKLFKSFKEGREVV